MSYTLDFADGIIGVLVTAGAGVYRSTTDPAQKYTADEVGIALNSVPDDPASLIALFFYSPGGGDLLTTYDRMAFQLRTRAANIRDAMTLHDTCSSALAGLHNRQFGSVHLTALNKMASVSPVRDDRNRWTSMTQFYADVDLPATSNRS